MQTSQLILLGLLGAFILYLMRGRSDSIDRLAYLALATLGLALVAKPEWSNAAARLVGIGRGADLVFYFFIVFCLFHFSTTAQRLRRLERHITTLTRELALARPLHPPQDTGGPSESPQPRPGATV